MRASRRLALVHHLQQFAKSTGLPLDYVRKSPRKNDCRFVRLLPEVSAFYQESPERRAQRAENRRKCRQLAGLPV